MFVKQVFVPLKINSQAMVWKKKVYLYIYHNIYIYIVYFELYQNIINIKILFQYH